ncbi:MAG: flagellar biosynthetic protein FliO [Sulfuricellaceae bacterium]
MRFRVKTVALIAMPAALLALPFSVTASLQPAVSAVAPMTPMASPISLGGMFQVLLGLLLVLAAVAATAWLLRRISLGQSVMGNAVRVVGGVALGQRERLVLVEVGETWLLLGVAPGQVNALHTMPRPENAAQVETPSSVVAAFPAWLMQAMHKRSKN